MRTILSILLACLCFLYVNLMGDTIAEYIQEAIHNERIVNDQLFSKKEDIAGRVQTITGLQSNQLNQIDLIVSQPKKYALCVGISDYSGTSRDLPGSVHGAKRFEFALKRYGYEVQVLTNASATKTGFITSFSNMLSRAKMGDVCVLTFDGHGSYILDLDGDELINHPGDDRDEVILMYHPTLPYEHLVDDELHRMIKLWLKPKVQLIIFMASCYSGTMDRGITPRAIAPIVYQDEPYIFISATPPDALGYQRRRSSYVRPWEIGMPYNMFGWYMSDLSFHATQLYIDAFDKGWELSVTNFYNRMATKCPGPPVLHVSSNNVNFIMTPLRK